MSKQTYYATPDNLIQRSSTIDADWVEVVIVAKKVQHNGDVWYIVKTLDGSRLFTTSDHYLFDKVIAPEEGEK